MSDEPAQPDDALVPTFDALSRTDSLADILREVAAAPAPPESDRTIADQLVPGSVIDGTYRIVRRLGSGGVGVVYLAQDLSLERQVALKLHHAGVRTTVRTTRMWREAKAMARLTHPNVISVYEVGVHDERVFIAMEYVDGGSASSWLAARSNWRERLSLYVAAGQGLAAAHAVGLVHRDFKPDNILVGRDDRPRVADFGLAREQGEYGAEPTSAELELVNQRLTATGAMVGTPAYMAPEQLAGGTIDHRADQFAFCVALYEALYETSPFPLTTVAARWLALRGAPRAIPRSRIPAHIGQAILRGLAFEPEARWSDMHALLAELQRDPAARRRRLGAAAGVIGAVAVTAWVSMRSPASQPCPAADELLAEIWDDQRRSELDRAIADTGSVLAAQVWPGVRGRLDRHAEEWVAARHEACVATRVRGDQSEALLDLRMGCLDRKKAELAALVDVFGHADVTTLENAGPAVDALPSLDRCADADALLADVPPPDDPVVRDRVDEMRTRIAAARALLAAGHVREGLDAAQRIVTDSAAIEYPALHAVAYGTLGFAQGDAAQRQEAEDALGQCYWLALSAGDDSTVAECARELVLRVGQRPAGFDEAMLWYRTAEAAGTRIGAGPTTRAELLAHRGAAHEQHGDLILAEQDYAAAVALVRDVKPGSGQLVELLLDQGGAMHWLGRYAEALALREEALALARELWGRSHPLVARTLREMSSDLHSLSRPGDALAAAMLATQLGIEVYGPDSRMLAADYSHVAQALYDLGSQDASLAYQEAALAQVRRVAPEDAPALLTQIEAIVPALQVVGHYHRALELAREGVAIAESVYGPEDLEVAEALSALASALLQVHDFEGAAAASRRALAVAEKRLGSRHASIVTMLINLTTILSQAPHLNEAEQILDRAEAIAAELPPDETAKARITSKRADLRAAQGRHAEAAVLHARAVELFETNFGPLSPHAITGLHLLGMDYLAAGVPKDAIAPLERAIELGQRSGHSPQMIERMRFRLARALFASGRDRVRAVEIAREVERRLGNYPDQRAELPAIEAWLRTHDR